jgi:hypothetical protein
MRSIIPRRGFNFLSRVLNETVAAWHPGSNQPGLNSSSARFDPHSGGAFVWRCGDAGSALLPTLRQQPSGARDEVGQDQRSDRAHRHDRSGDRRSSVAADLDARLFSDALNHNSMIDVIRKADWSYTRWRSTLLVGANTSEIERKLGPVGQALVDNRATLAAERRRCREHRPCGSADRPPSSSPDR